MSPRGTRQVTPLAWVAAGVLGVFGVVVVFADLLGIDHSTPFVQLIAFRPQIAGGLVVLGAVAAVLGRGAWPVAVALGVVGLLGVVTVLPRATGGTDGPVPGGTFDVLTVNTYLGRADPGALAGIVRDRHPAVVVLPEAGEDLQKALVDELGASRYRPYIANSSRDESPMTVLVSRSLGSPAVTIDRTGEFPSIVLTVPPGRGTGHGLRVVATHPQSPKPGEGWAWRRDIAGLARWCAGNGPPTVVAGDLNASLDHAELRAATRGCTDAASSVGQGLAGTWPVGLPPLLGSAIDHVLLARGPRPRSAEVVDVPGSDHRGLLARLTLGP